MGSFKVKAPLTTKEQAPGVQEKKEAGGKNDLRPQLPSEVQPHKFGPPVPEQKPFRIKGE